MIISMKKGAPQEEINKLVRSFEEMGLSVTTIYGEDYNVFGLVGDTTRVDETQIAVNPYVDTVTRVSAPYKKVTASSTRRTRSSTAAACASAARRRSP